jgi:DNA-binding NtrC family response regulator
MVSVLIFSEDQDIGRMLLLVISKNGHQAVHVETPSQLLEVIQSNFFDLIILERLHGIRSDDLDLIASYLPERIDSPLIIATSWLFDEKLENYCNQLNVKKKFLYPCDLVKEILEVSESLSQGN